tara:strand:+ start:1199 stop:1399 length:201 start_codon:yes stop_codon:yes gene_type:complete
MKITFKCNQDPLHANITFHKENDLLVISSNDGDDFSDVFLKEQDLFLLIGQLLRIQSEFRKEVGNV